MHKTIQFTKYQAASAGDLPISLDVLIRKLPLNDRDRSGVFENLGENFSLRSGFNIFPLLLFNFYFYWSFTLMLMDCIRLIFWFSSLMISGKRAVSNLSIR